MSRPSDEQVQAALVTLAPLVADSRAHVLALKTLERAAERREVWPSKEASEYLDVRTAHLPKLKGLPAPVQTLDRPSTTHPDKKAYLYDADEIRAFGVSTGRVKEGGQ